MDHFGSKKSQNPDKIVEPMVVANRIPQERKATLDNYQIEWREIPEQRFREVAAEKGYVFETEQKRPIEDSLLRSPVSPSANHPPATAPDLPAEWVKVVWKDDCADARRKGNAEFARYGEYLTRLTSSAESTPA
jgi:cytochrome c1